MPKFRKIPVVVEAMQVTEDNVHAVIKWIKTNRGDAIKHWEEGFLMLIKTLEGNMLADPGDWIVKGVKGEFYPVKPDIFAETYEEVTDD